MANLQQRYVDTGDDLGDYFWEETAEGVLCDSSEDEATDVECEVREYDPELRLREVIDRFRDVESDSDLDDEKVDASLSVCLGKYVSESSVVVTRKVPVASCGETACGSTGVVAGGATSGATGGVPAVAADGVTDVLGPVAALPAQPTAPAADEAVEPVANLAQAYADLKERCKCICSDCCLSFMCSRVEEVRYQTQSLSKTEHDLLILGKISTGCSRDKSVNTTSHAKKERKKARTKYQHEGEFGKIVC